MEDWNNYFTSPKPHAIDESSTQHQMIISLYNYAKFPFFTQLFKSKTLPLGLEITLDYQKAISIQGDSDE